MAVTLTFRVDRPLPTEINPWEDESVTLDIFDQDKIRDVLGDLKKLDVTVLSAISANLNPYFVKDSNYQHPDLIAAVVTSDNFEHLANESYKWPPNFSDQRTPVDAPLRVYTTPRGKFSQIGFCFAAKAAFRSFVDQMAQSFKYSTGDVIRKGKVLPSWSRIEPLREVACLSPASLGKLRDTPDLPYRSKLLWMGDPLGGDFGFVWDRLQCGHFQLEKCALVPIETAIVLSKSFFPHFCAEPVFDRGSETATLALDGYRRVLETLPQKGWL